MEFRYLGNSGLKVSEITYGNWLTHGSQVENDTATRCVRAALDTGISSFDTADVYANTVAERVLGDALRGERRESLEIFTKVFGPTGPKGHNDTGLSANTSSSRSTARSPGCRPTTSISTKPIATTWKPRSTKPCRPLPTWCARARPSTSA